MFERVIASAAKQSMPVYGAKWIASSQTLLAMTGKQLRPAPSSSVHGRKIHERSDGRRAIAGAGTGVPRRWRTLQRLNYNSTTT
jgi:hypothetical protein